MEPVSLPPRYLFPPVKTGGKLHSSKTILNSTPPAPANSQTQQDIVSAPLWSGAAQSCGAPGVVVGQVRRFNSAPVYSACVQSLCAACQEQRVTYSKPVSAAGPPGQSRECGEDGVEAAHRRVARALGVHMSASVRGSRPCGPVSR